MLIRNFCILWALILVLQHSAFADDQGLSLNFDNARVSSILRTIASLAQRNVVFSDDINGSMSLFVKKMNWPAALELVLKSQHLSLKNLDAHTWYISKDESLTPASAVPAVNVAEKSTQALIRTRFFRIHYAKPEAILQILQNNRALLSASGQVAFDARTDTLIVSDTTTNLLRVQELLQQIDVPVPEVEISAKIVVVNKSALEALGVTLTQGENAAVSVLGSIKKMAVNLPITNPAGIISFSLGKLSSQELNLELQALEASGDGKVISAPQLIVSNNQEAYIEEGSEVPYQTSTSSGATQIEFKKAVLGLKVVPRITVPNMLDLKLQVNKDSVTGETASVGLVPIIATREVRTELLMKSGETLVLGGIYTEEKSLEQRGVPLLSGIPGLGWLFKSRKIADKYTDLLVFISPRIILPTKESS